jgi:hypothetical protein
MYTDHKPLTFAFSQKPERCSPRQCRQLDLISQFSTDIRHVKGDQNIIADFLSRIEAITKADFDHNLLTTMQEQDPELQTLRKQNKFHFTVAPVPSSTKELWYETSHSPRADDEFGEGILGNQKLKKMYYLNVSESGIDSR